MTRIAMIAGTYLPQQSGIPEYTAHLCTALNEHHIHTTVLTTYSAAEAAYDPNALGVVHGWRLPNLQALGRAVRGTGADILHIQYAPSLYGFERTILLLPLLLRVTGWRAPIVTTVHDYGWWEWQPKGIPPQLLEWLKMWGQGHHWWDRETGFLLTLSDAVITTNTEVEAAIQQRLPQLDERIHRISVATDSQQFNWETITRSHLEVYQALINRSLPLG